MKLKIALLPGDGIGPEIVGEAVKACSTASLPSTAISSNTARRWSALVRSTRRASPVSGRNARRVRSVGCGPLFGAIGDPKYDNNPAAKVRPEQGLLRMRKSLGLLAQTFVRWRCSGSLAGRSPLSRPKLSRGPISFACVSLTGGMYFGRPQGRSEDGNTAYDTCALYARGDRAYPAPGFRAGPGTPQKTDAGG
ncbi:MAG: isocitrate/isopropylmalate family dehydrogenase [Alistipes indistinctus]